MRLCLFVATPEKATMFLSFFLRSEIDNTGPPPRASSLTVYLANAKCVVADLNSTKEGCQLLDCSPLTTTPNKKKEIGKSCPFDNKGTNIHSGTKKRKIRQQYNVTGNSH